MKASSALQQSRFGQFKMLIGLIVVQCEKGETSFRYRGKLPEATKELLSKKGYVFSEDPIYPPHGLCWDGTVDTVIDWSNPII